MANGDIAPTIIQAVAREIHGPSVKGSLTTLSKATGITLDALRIAKRTPGTSGARLLQPPRVKHLALILAAHRKGILKELLEDADAIEQEWRKAYPDGLAD